MMHLNKPPLGTPLDWENKLNDGLVLHLAMNEGHGDVVRDLSLYGNHGTLNNFAFPSTVASGWNPGYKGVGLNFDGINDYVDCDNNPVLWVQNSDFVLQCWLKPTTNDGEAIVGKERLSTNSWGVYQSGGKFYFRLKDSVSSATVPSDNSYTINNWYHICGIRKNNILYMYVNGVEQTTTPACAFSPATDSFNFFIGRRVQDSDYNFTGSVDQVRIHNRALTPQEIKDYTINPWQVYLDE